MPRVSVIIPTHKRAGFLKGAIESVLGQTFKDFELLVVDDGSRDATEEVVKSFQDPRLRFFQHAEAKGGSAARNTGIRNSRGEYLAFLDDDDAWYPDKLRLQVELMDRSEARVGVIYAGYDKFDSATGRVGKRRLPKLRGNLREALLVANPLTGTSSVLIRRECFEVAGPFDETLTAFQDFDLWLRIAAHYEFDFIPEALHRYTIHGVKIWTNLDALSAGVERILEKHGEYAPVRRRFAQHCVMLGQRHCVAGNAAKGRRALRRAFGLNPRLSMIYIYYAASFFGPGGFRALSALRNRFSAAQAESNANGAN
jgi:glycosyltransferase involved in cell wall biosynthesis